MCCGGSIHRDANGVHIGSVRQLKCIGVYGSGGQHAQARRAGPVLADTQVRHWFLLWPPNTRFLVMHRHSHQGRLPRWRKWWSIRVTLSFQRWRLPTRPKCDRGFKALFRLVGNIDDVQHRVLS